MTHPFPSTMIISEVHILLFSLPLFFPLCLCRGSGGGGDLYPLNQTCILSVGIFIKISQSSCMCEARDLILPLVWLCPAPFGWVSILFQPQQQYTRSHVHLKKTRACRAFLQQIMDRLDISLRVLCHRCSCCNFLN